MEVSRKQLDVHDDPGVLSPPIVSAPLYGCASVVNVTGYVPNALLDVDVDGVLISNVPGGLPYPFGAMVGIPVELIAGQVVRARQRVGAATSVWSAGVTVRDHLADYPAGPPRPELFPLPLFDCGVRSGVSNLLIGSRVWITADGATVGNVSGANNPQGVNVTSYVTGQSVRAWSSLCDDPSPPSVAQTVQVAPSPLGAPGFDPIYADGSQLVVNGLADGATFTLSRGGVLMGTFACWGGRCTITLPTPFTAGETFSATQQLCPSGGSSPPGGGVVLPCSALPAPQVAPVQDGDTQVSLTSFVAGSDVKVFVNLVKTGDGSGPVIALTAPVPPQARIDVWQVLGTCQGQTAQELTALCVAPPVTGDPSALDFFPIGTVEYDGGGTDIDGFHYNIRGSIYYPADDDGVAQPFNARLAALGPVPVVVLVHGAHDPSVPNYRGYDYFQQALARMGIVAVSVDENETNQSADWSGWTSNVVRRAELGLANVAYLQQLNAADARFQGRFDLSRLGLMGHSRGAECVLAMAERLTLPGVSIRAVLSLAPINSGAQSGHPRGFAFMTFLPAADGDVVANNGAQFYDQAAGSLKIQLYIDSANHNYFNRQWANDDTRGLLPVMARSDHERILLSYGSALFRWALRGDATQGYLLGSELPAGVQNQKIHLSYDLPNQRVVDDYEGHPITVDTEGGLTAQLGGLVAKDYPFSQSAGAFNQSFFGNTTGNVSRSDGHGGDFRSALAGPADLTRAAIWVRAAEVYAGANVPANATGFRVGAEDGTGTIGWVDVDEVGGLPRPFDRRAFDALTKSMLSTFRFPGTCFAAAEAKLNVAAIRAVHFGLNRGDNRPIAFDDLEIVG